MAGKHIDHIAFRVADLEKAVKFYTEVMEFEVTDRFFIDFEDDTKARCAALKAKDGQGISVFLSEGVGEGGVVKEWVKEHGNALHHIAYAVDDIKKEVADMKKRGIQFTTEEVLDSEELTQIFTKPAPETGIIHEIIQRKGSKSFSVNNVKRLMASTRDLNKDETAKSARKK
ncbi:MAG TPA: VOC family protein [Nitrospiria bacterium]|jgi:4-hydroxyphenylpyruvate dioxygenase-like putative hemolysin|nr:VOC family protein [Nitrospiria bacterium]